MGQNVHMLTEVRADVILSLVLSLFLYCFVLQFRCLVTQEYH